MSFLNQSAFGGVNGTVIKYTEVVLKIIGIMIFYLNKKTRFASFLEVKIFFLK